MATHYETKQKELRDQILQTTEQVKVILDQVEAEKREMTDAEKTSVDNLMLRAKGLDVDMKDAAARAERSAKAAPFKAIAEDLWGGRDKTYLPAGKIASRASWGDAIVKANSDGIRYKGLTTTGTILVDIPAPDATVLGRPVHQLRSLMPNKPTDGVYSYLRQDLRTNNAEFVAPGEKKPTSDLLFTRVQDRVRTLAHLTSRLHRADLADSDILWELAAGELGYGIEAALEAQMIAGDGVGENLLGLANTPGILTATRATDDGYGLVRVMRSALTKLEVMGLAASGIVMHPQNWEELETAVLEDGSLAFNGGGTQSLPLDSSARRAWSLPVISSVGCPLNTAFVADFAGSTILWLREEATLSWADTLYDPNMYGAGQGGNLFESNQVVLRCEGRFGWAVTRPSGVVKVDLVAPVTP